MKKQDSAPSQSEDLQIRPYRDLLSYLPRDAWSCLTLDFADKLAPMVGKEGMQLYYYLSQLVEGVSTKFQGMGEDEFYAYFNEHYVQWSATKGAQVDEQRRGFLADVLGTSPDYIPPMTPEEQKSGKLYVGPVQPLYVTGQVGGPFAFSYDHFKVANTGDALIDWIVKETYDWLTFTPDRGTLVPNQSQTVWITPTWALGSAPPGGVTDYIHFQNTTSFYGDVVIEVGVWLSAQPGGD